MFRTRPAKGSAGEAGLHRAARLEDAVHERVQRRVGERGWRPAVTTYTGYGAPGWARVMGRVLMTRPHPRERTNDLVRGWRSFLTVPVDDAEVRITAAGREHTVRTDRGGYVDARVECDLPVGWSDVVLAVEGAQAATAPIRVVDPSVRFGLLSDIDDTVMVTALPRALLAAWNTFVLNEQARSPVPGMAVLYERIMRANPDAPFVYLSTGAWNVAPTLTRFLGRHLYPAGPLLLTDWGPTTDRWFRSGQAHKEASLDRLASEFPSIRWLLVGDDGQHDPQIYSDFARRHPDNVAAVAIRTLSPSEQLLASGLPMPMDQARDLPDTHWVSAPNGAALAARLHPLGLL